MILLVAPSRPCGRHAGGGDGDSGGGDDCGAGDSRCATGPLLAAASV